ncbi:MAG: tetratricopeptide repeat protein [Candidatus Gastranaerophilaceae bacterium]
MRKNINIRHKKSFSNIKSLNHIKIVIITGIIFILSFIIFYCCSFNAAEKGKIYYEEGQYQKAASYLQRAINLKKTKLSIAKWLNTKNNKHIATEINDLLLDIAFCYSESGDIKRALRFYSDLYSRLKNDTSDEAICNFVKLQIGLCYSYLGYFDKAIPIFEELKAWYPQNLIFAYINSKNFDKARVVLFSDVVQDKISEGDDIDAAALNYALFEYYKETCQYDRAFKNHSEEMPEFEATLLKNVQNADLYNTLGKYEQSAELYEKLIYNPEFSQRTQNKMKIKYALVLASLNKNQEAANLLKEVEGTLKESYRLSPDIICTKYYFSKIFNDEKLKKDSFNLFRELSLSKESLFYRNIDDYCKINLQYQ